MPDQQQFRNAVVMGAARPFGAEIAARLRRDGFAVSAAAEGADISVFSRVWSLDALVFNTPLKRENKFFLDIADEDFADVLRTQLYELMAAGQAAAPHLRRGGAIVHLASRAHLGAGGAAHQSAAGAALVAMSRCMALEFEARGVRVNTVAADFVGEAWDTPEAREDVARAVAYLAGRESKLVSGETLLLDQARALRMTEAARR